MVPGDSAARRGNGVTHVWNEPSRAVYDRTYRVLFDAGLNEELADELATQRTLAAAFRRARTLYAYVIASTLLPGKRYVEARRSITSERLLLSGV